ncbi:MAG: S-glutathionyl-(chloro)hydroquinone reductase [Vezdaea aestivalis]|nr:MAG: S-glutathionyl-(chloro)hydroquinone reductase [Vezdaea aestivalis]
MTSQSGSRITDWVDPKDTSGEFKRGQSQFRNFISRDSNSRFQPEKDRYHLYVSYACPWAHRTLIVRKLKGLEEIIPITCVHWHMLEKGWRFVTADENLPGEGANPDPLHQGITHLRNLYFDVDSEYKGRFTVPTLYDKKLGTIVSNESSEIIRMFYTEFDDLLPEKYQQVNLFPAELRKNIEETNTWTYDNINNGVYKSGFATTQPAYEKAVTALFENLDRAEKHLESAPGPFYYGKSITEADVRLYTTVVRFDPVYVQHFKCNIRDIRSGYPALHKWLRNLYWNVPAFGDTTQFEHIKKHYTKSHHQINPFSITPLGPVPDVLAIDKEVRVV